MALICYHNLNPLSPKALDLILLISAPRGTTSKAAGRSREMEPTRDQKAWRHWNLCAEAGPQIQEFNYCTKKASGLQGGAVSTFLDSHVRSQAGRLS